MYIHSHIPLAKNGPIASLKTKDLQFNDLRLQQAKELAIKLMSELKEEYHLK
jgi:hypothetical protein